MTRLILTNDISAAGSLKMADLADIVIPIERRLVLGPPPSDAESVGFFAARSKQEHGLHWQDYTPPWRLEKFGGRDLGLIECCANCESVELWMDAAPNAQLLLIWLLDHFRFYGNVALRLALLQADLLIGGKAPEDIAKWRPSAVKVANDHLETASLAWQAHRAPTPQAWFSLLDKDLGIL